MADVTGPIASLPGSLHTVPQGMLCDECGKPAVVRVQGETDSMGSEMHDLCVECTAKHDQRTETSGECDWCHKQVDVLKPTRDYDEGSTGPVYQVCGDCIRKQNEEARQALLEENFDEIYNDVIDELEEEEDLEDDDYEF